MQVTNLDIRRGLETKRKTTAQYAIRSLVVFTLFVSALVANVYVLDYHRDGLFIAKIVATSLVVGLSAAAARETYRRFRDLLALNKELNDT